MSLSPAGIAAVSAQQTSEVVLVLLVFSHPNLPAPVRLTSDTVPTVWRGDVYSPGGFQIQLPESVEGRAPYAQLRLDNTSQEMIAILRGLEKAPDVDIIVVRAGEPQDYERWITGLQLRGETYDLGFIVGRLTLDDIALEEFPFITFDQARFPGLFS